VTFISPINSYSVSTYSLEMILKSSSKKRNLVLRTLRTEDAERIARLANNKKVWDNVRDQMPHPYALKDAEYFISLSQKNDPPVTFGIEVDDTLCGVVGLQPQSDVYRKSAEMGYWIGEPYWGRGIATAAVGLIAIYGFEQLGLVRIFAGVFEFNLASMRVLEKNGFLKEGISRKAVIKNGQLYDEHKYGKVII
jgi:RimJ/RimL family protein N-acetyltransferase